MATSINGWQVLDNPAWDDSRLTHAKIPGTPCVFYGRASVAPLFISLALDYHATIHPLTGSGDVDAYDYRIARASSSYSDHAAGVAMDIRASAEGAQGTSTYDWWVGAKSAAARVIKARYEIFIWGAASDLGGDYGNPRYFDSMHWALKPGTSQADVDRVIRKLGIRPDGTRGAAPAPLSPHQAHLQHLQSTGQPLPVLSPHAAHLAHLVNTGQPLPKPAPAPKPAPLSAHQLHLQHLQSTGQPLPKPAPVAGVLKGEAAVKAWLANPARKLSPAVQRVLWCIAVRESGCDSQMQYPAGTHDPTMEQPPSDWGLWQVNSTHLPSIRVTFGPAADMRAMLDPVKALAYVAVISNNFTRWLDWGFRLDATGGVVFDWSEYPAGWVKQNGASAEAGLLAAFTRYTLK